MVEFDRDYFDIGVLEPEFVTEIDWEAFDRMYPPDEIEFEVRNGCGEVCYVGVDKNRMGHARHFPDAPKKTELRWRNTLLDSPAP